jgi:hypothetical protein
MKRKLFEISHFDQDHLSKNEYISNYPGIQNQKDLKFLT